MTTDQMNDLKNLDAELAKDHLRGLWVREETIRREPAPFGKAILWKWQKIRAGLEAAGRLITTNYKGARRNKTILAAPAVLFFTTDRPLHEAIGVYREQSR